MIWNWIIHVFGVDTQQSRWYDFWSGIATQAGLLFVGLGVYRRGICGKRWCWRRGHFQLTDPVSNLPRMLCWRHHPDVQHKHADHAIHLHRQRGQ